MTIDMPHIGDDRTRLPAPRLLRSTRRALLALFVGLHIISTSSLTGLLPHAAAQGTLAIMAGTVVLLALVGLWQGQMLPVLGSLTITLWVGLQLLVFATHAGVPPNANMALSYCGLIALPLFALARDDAAWMVRVTFALAAAYCLAYLLVVLAGAVGGEARGLHMLRGDSRGTRLAIAPAYVALALFGGLACLQHRPGAGAGVVVAAAVAVLALAAYRVFATELLLLAGTVLFRGAARRLRPVIAIIVVVAVLCNLAGVFTPGWSIYALGGSDPSIAARALAYRAIGPALAAHPILGLGLPGNGADLWAYLRQPYTFWEDLGPTGIWAAFGLAGLLLLCGLLALLIGGPHRSALPPPWQQALAVTGLACALLATYSADAFGGGSAIIAGLVLASRYAGEAQPAPA